MLEFTVSLDLILIPNWEAIGVTLVPIDLREPVGVLPTTHQREVQEKILHTPQKNSLAPAKRLTVWCNAQEHARQPPRTLLYRYIDRGEYQVNANSNPPCAAATERSSRKRLSEDVRAWNEEVQLLNCRHQAVSRKGKSQPCLRWNWHGAK